MNYYNLINSMSRGGVVYDADAQAFLTATGIIDLTISDAINTLVISLKANGVWAKSIAIYPFVGGTAFTHKWNLKNPLDTDVAHRISFVASPTHSSNGVLCDNGACNLHIIPTTDFTLNDTHFTYYSRTDLNSASAYDIFNSGSIQIFSRLSNLFLSDMYDLAGLGGRILVANTNSIGVFCASRLATPTHRLYKNGSQVATNSTTAGSLVSASVFLGSNGSTTYSQRQYAYLSVGFGLTNTEVTDEYNAIATFNTALGR